MQNKLLVVILSLCISLSFSHNASGEKGIDKPYGTFSSKITSGAAAHDLCKGLLIRTSWSKLEPRPGHFDFYHIEKQIKLAEANVKNPSTLSFSLAVYSGLAGRDSTGYPAWLIDLGVETMPIVFRGKQGLVPKMWDLTYQKRLKILAEALAEKYSTDKRFKLIYVPQATANGVEGHFNGTDYDVLKKHGLNEKNWYKAIKQATISFADSFENSAIAIEVHHILGSHKIPMKLLNDFYKDEKYRDQVGAGMWWISGKTQYQRDLIEALKKYPGDIYGQAIGNSSQLHRFEKENFANVFYQACELNVRYIECWNFEFENSTQDDNIQRFNQYCLETFIQGKETKIPDFSKPIEVKNTRIFRSGKRK